MTDLLSLPQPKAQYGNLGYNVRPMKLEEPVLVHHPDLGLCRIVSTNGRNIREEETFGIEYGPDFRFYQRDTLENYTKV